MFTEGEDGAVDDQRVLVIETGHERRENVVVDLHVGDLIQRLAPDGDVAVT